MTTQKKKSKVRRVQAVGFATLNPNFVVVFQSYSPNKGDKVFAYPPENSEEEFKLPKQTDDARNFVILLAPEKYHELYRHAKRIHRLLICGRGQVQQLLDTGVPIVDAEIKNGKVTKSLSFRTVDDLRQIIDEDASPLKIPAVKTKKSVSVIEKPKKVKKKPTKKKKSKKKTSATAEAPELLPLLKEIKADFDGDAVDYQNAVLIPIILRLLKDMDRNEFKDQCKLLEENVENTKLCKKLYSFLEKKYTVGGGRKLSLATRKYVDEDEQYEIEELAEKYGLSAKDLKWSIKAVRKLEASVAEDR